MISVPISINFGTDGFRGIIGDSFTFEVVNHISLSLGRYLKENSIAGAGEQKTAHGKNSKNLLNAVAIGYDTRFLSKEFAITAAAALASAGINVILSDNFCPSPDGSGVHDFLLKIFLKLKLLKVRPKVPTN